jgi:TusA-related sulfurtransferase
MTDALQPDVELNLKGEICPYTFVKSKLALEEMEIGQVLAVLVDHVPAVDNMPRSLANEGQEVLEVKQINETDWAIMVKKTN